VLARKVDLSRDDVGVAKSFEVDIVEESKKGNSNFELFSA
jgi:hypothetical protein